MWNKYFDQIYKTLIEQELQYKQHLIEIGYEIINALEQERSRSMLRKVGEHSFENRTFYYPYLCRENRSHGTYKSIQFGTKEEAIEFIKCNPKMKLFKWDKEQHKYIIQNKNSYLK